MSDLTIATFNVRQLPANDGPNSWPLRRELLLETARSLDADVLGTQEPFAEQVDAIADALPGFRLVGVGRVDGIRAGEWSAIFVRESRLSVLEEGNFWLSETPSIPGSKGWDALSHPRLCTWAMILDRESGRRFLVCNAHWDHEGEIARRHSAGMTAAWLADRPAGVPAVVTGDFNCGPDSAPLRYLTGQSETPQLPEGGSHYPLSPALTDAWAVTHPAAPHEGTFHGFHGEAQPVSGHIDHILVTEGLRVVSCDVVRTGRDGRWPSDHFPVVARLAWMPEETVETL